MNDAMSLQQIIYNFLAVQIEFGAYRCGDILPAMEETSRWFSVSLDTVRSACLKLEQEGRITLTKKVGAAVAVQYSPKEIECHIQTFFSVRREAVIDLCRALGPLFNRAQWFSMKRISTEQLDRLEEICKKSDINPAHRMLREVHIIYSTLNNDLLLRLVWQAYMFFQGPFLSLPENMAAAEPGDMALLGMIELCRQKNWDKLWHVICGYQTQLYSAICSFYEERITMAPPGETTAFCWSAYEKSSQQRYSLAMVLLKDIRRGHYPAASFLPSPAQIAEERQVSVITVRRTLALLKQLGAVQSVNGVGTKVLKAEDSAQNCDFSQPILKKRLSDFAQSLQILALTCKETAEITLAVMAEPELQWWKELLIRCIETGRHETVVFVSLEMLSQSVPVRAVQEIYEQLLQILLWGYPLRGIHGSRSDINAFYLPYLDTFISCLEQHDAEGLASHLEALLRYEFEFAVTHLEGLGIKGVSRLVI